MKKGTGWRAEDWHVRGRKSKKEQAESKKEQAESKKEQAETEMRSS